MITGKNVKPPYRWGLSIREIIASQAEILNRLSKGHCIRHIWQDLRRSGKVTTCEGKFYKNVRRLRTLHSEIGGRPVTGIDFWRKSR